MRDDGRGPDRWTYMGPGAQARRIEYDEDGDGQFERAELFEDGSLVAVELDTSRDGKPHRWQRWVRRQAARRGHRHRRRRQGRPSPRLRRQGPHPRRAEDRMSPRAGAPGAAAPDAESDVAGTGVRITLLVALVLTPFLFASFYPWVFGPFHALCLRRRPLHALAAKPPAGSGRAASRPSPRPAPSLAFVGVILVQLVPLPAALLRLVSPGTYEFHSSRCCCPRSRPGSPSR